MMERTSARKMMKGTKKCSKIRLNMIVADYNRKSNQKRVSLPTTGNVRRLGKLDRLPVRFSLILYK